MKMPTGKEQEIARVYVLQHELSRPDTDVKKAIVSGVCFLVINFAIATATFLLFDLIGIFALLPSQTYQLLSSDRTKFIIWYYAIIFIIAFVLSWKKICIGMVKMYQHYASEDTRRRCLLKPTCSEYALLVLKKYWLPVALVMIYIRLFRKCYGNVYYIDYPF